MSSRPLSELLAERAPRPLTAAENRRRIAQARAVPAARPGTRPGDIPNRAANAGSQKWRQAHDRLFR